jgi:hypothetical protein
VLAGVSIAHACIPLAEQALRCTELLLDALWIAHGFAAESVLRPMELTSRQALALAGAVTLLLLIHQYRLYALAPCRPPAEPAPLPGGSMRCRT